MGMIERVAAATMARAEEIQQKGGTMEAARSHGWEWQEVARAAIEAMREPPALDPPPHDMVREVKYAWDRHAMTVEGPTSVAAVACRAVFEYLERRAVIDAALKD